MVNFLSIIFVFCYLCFAKANSSLKFGFYNKSCPYAEAIVKDVVNQAYAQDSGIAPALIRLHFHDCFVRGCDGSILLDSTAAGKAEKDSPMNKGVQGFEIIDKAKTLIESKCPATVSCADIVAFAARDSVFFSGGLHYSVHGGRRDGRISRIGDPAAGNLPSESFHLRQLKLNFAKKGLSTAEMVALSGAHSIGDSHCSSFNKRLYSFNKTYGQDPTMDADYAEYLKRRCPAAGGGGDPVVAMDPTTPARLDENYYKNLMKKKGLLESDQTLWDSGETKEMVKRNGDYPEIWAEKFARAMMKMGSIQILSGKRGEIRKNCRVVNY
ncbi:peroxidase 5-like [Andrographis paniculata]|uniref:peroxidase 5-like n=1 Tax=Andrographis paniculata TaxID=175694 RepID=UPI0021E8C81C|nr:peroxidase 5-like [Andrographis paniculata]